MPSRRAEPACSPETARISPASRPPIPRYGCMPSDSRRVLLSWSSGKDSAWTLHVLRQRPDVEVVGLLTTFNEAVDRVAMHAVRRALVEAQAVAAGLPLWPVPLPWPCSNAEYEQRMSAAIGRAR